MAKVEIANSLFSEIERKFKEESHEIIDLLYTLESNPRKGKVLGTVGGIVIKELRYKSFRFFFITDGFKLKCTSEEDLVDLLLRFVRMSDKKTQNKVIQEIKDVLIKIGPMGFD